MDIQRRDQNMEEKFTQEQQGDNKRLKEVADKKTELGVADDVAQMGDEVEEWKDKYLRLVAELDNTKKRLAKKLQIELEEKIGSILLDMLPVADNLERILAYAKESGEKELVRGLEITFEAFQEAMKKYGVSRIDARGKPFNPEIHEAIGAIPTPRFEEGTVVEVEQTGYVLDGKVLRPAKVLIVSR